MFGRLCAMALLLAAALLSVGCASGEASPVSGGVAESPLPTGASLPGAEVIAKGEQLQYDDPAPQFLVLTTEQEWQSFWQTYLPREGAAPEVDLAQSVVLVGIQGAKNSGGYDIRFTGLEADGEEVWVTVEMEEPAPGTMVETVLTQPYVAVEVDRDRLPSRGSVPFVFATGAGEEVGRVTAALAQNRDIAPSGAMPTTPPIAYSEAFAGAEVLAEGDRLPYADPEPRFLVLTTQQELDGFWKTYLQGTGTVPQVDWTDSFVLVGIQGNKSTGGYHIRFLGLEQLAEEVRVVTELVTPRADEPVDMAFSQPYLVVLVDAEALATPGALTFVFETSGGEELARVPATVPNTYLPTP